MLVKQKRQTEHLVLTLFYMTACVYQGINLNLSLDLMRVNSEGNRECGSMREFVLTFVN